MQIKKSKNSNTFLVKVFDNDEYNVTVNFAIVKLGAKLLEEISFMKETLLKTKNKIAGTYELTAFRNAVDWVCEEEIEDKITSDGLLAEMEELTEKSSVVPIKILDETGFVFSRTETDMLHVKDYGINFSAYIKHTSVFLETETISFDDIHFGTLGLEKIHKAYTR